jgi:hypothetical protein
MCGNPAVPADQRDDERVGVEQGVGLGVDRSRDSVALGKHLDHALVDLERNSVLLQQGGNLVGQNSRGGAWAWTERVSRFLFKVDLATSSRMGW